MKKIRLWDCLACGWVQNPNDYNSDVDETGNCPECGKQMDDETDFIIVPL
ncbi:MAG: hypothetical protein QME51_10630 [Planctomycetota bacterium]|nr:hypothetical protein [Planctomycetota bacterium]